MMRLVNTYNENTLYIKENSIDKKCYMCGSLNIVNGVCADCNNDGSTIYYVERPIKYHKHTVYYEFSLSNEQKEASQFFLNHLKNKSNAFLYAVCGSGKTEIMYESILYALNNKMKVLITIPRKEIVKELYGRLKRIFKETKITFIDGANHDDSGELLLSTVNQLIHYEDEFDLIILDEADAYPYAGNDYLHRLVIKSLKKDGVLFLMSATKKEHIPYDTFTIKKRYHNHELSMPNFIKCDMKNMAKSSAFLKLLLDERKHIIYVPTIKYAKELSSLLSIEYISSKSKDQDKLIKMLKNGSVKNIISTTILERGITIKDVDVIVLEAQDKVFTHQTLIQICGRVGRSYDDPYGSIYLFYRKNSLKFFIVRRYIKRMNSWDAQFVKKNYIST